MISKTIEYALTATVCLAGVEGQSLTAGQIAEQGGLPLGYLSKVLRLLARAQIVHSRRGPLGGFRLTRPATAISLLDVIKAVDPLEKIDTCPLGIKRNTPGLCPLYRRLDDAIKLLSDCFESTSLAEIIERDAVVQSGLKAGKAKNRSQRTKMAGTSRLLPRTTSGASLDTPKITPETKSPASSRRSRVQPDRSPPNPPPSE